MAEIIGFTTSIIALIQVTGKLTAIGYGYIGGVKRAPKDIAELVNELSSLGKQLIVLKDYTDRHPNSTVAQRLGSKDGPLRACLDDLNELQSILETGGGLKGVIANLKWPIKEKDTQGYISRIERQKSLIVFALTTENLSVSKEIETIVMNTNLAVRSLQDAASAQKTSISAEKRINVLNWLYAGDPSTKHLEITNRRQPGTGKWFLETPEFQGQLKQRPEYQMLWGYGIPGAGKTFLSSVVIDYLEESAVTENHGVAYIYFDYQERDQQTPLKVLGSLVKQLSAQIEDLPEGIENLYDKLVAKGKQVKFEALYGAFLETLRHFSHVFLVFDALDECDPQNQRKDLFLLFHRMGEEDNASLFVTSRQYPEDIQQSFQSWPKIELSAQKEDIEIYVKQRIHDSPRASRLVEQAKCQERIITELIDCAQGMFLVVHFHIEFLCQQATAKQLLTGLAKLRSTSARGGPLESAYDRCIKTINNQSKSCRQLGKVILMWLVKAQRILTVDELRVAVSVEPDRYELDDMDLPDKATILDVCAGLVTIDEDSNHIRLAHFTVQEYLLRKSVIPEQSNSTVAIACTTYASFKAFDKGACISYESFQARLKSYPFLDYAVRYLSYHIKDSDESLLTHACLKFLGSSGSTSSAVQVFRNYEEKLGGWIAPENYKQICVPLYLACYIGHAAIVRQLLREGASLSVTDDQGQTTLQIAASGGSIEVVRILLENGVDIEGRDKNGGTALHVAASVGHREVVQLLLDKGADVSACGSSGNTALALATHGGHATIVRLLLEKCSEVSMANNEGITPLFIAAHKGYGKIVQMLLERDLDLSLKDLTGSTALHHAAASGDKSVVQLLLDKGADLSPWNKYQQTALFTATAHGHEEVVQLFLNSGADISALNDSGHTALHLAALAGHRAVCELLIAKGLDLSIQDKEGSTALHLGACGGHEKVVQLLLERGANISIQNKAGDTALQLAVRQEHKTVTQLLIERGADISIPNNKGSTALHNAAFIGSDVLLQLLLEEGADFSVYNKFGNNALHCAAHSGNIVSVKLLFDKGAEHPVRNNTKMTALHFAAAGGNGEVIQLFLDKDTEFSVRDSCGDTPLHHAAKNGQQTAVQLLLEKGSSLLDRNDIGDTALHSAATGGHINIMQLLLSEGSELSTKNNAGNSVLHYAASGGFKAVVQLLLDQGADISAKNNDGETALQHAKRAGKTDVVNLLALDGLVKREAFTWWRNNMFIQLSSDNIIVKHILPISRSIIFFLFISFLYMVWGFSW